MALVWMPLVLLSTAGTLWRVRQAYAFLRDGGAIPGPLGWFGVDPAEFHELIARLPPPPAFGRCWPWLVLLVPLGVIGTWFHHAVWDHAGLWLLRGLKRRRGFRTTLVAEAEALRITAVGTLVGLLGFLPVLGLLLELPLVLMWAYLWLFRGYALAARHGCEPWRGVAATVLHAAMLGCFFLIFCTLSFLLLRLMA
jgi:hypothetical protein